MHRAVGPELRNVLTDDALPWEDAQATPDDVIWLEQFFRWYEATTRGEDLAPEVVVWVHTQATLRRRGTLPTGRFTLLDRTPGWVWVPHSTPLGKQAAEARMKRILELFDADATLEAIGEEFGLSRERVRQLVKPYRPSRTEVPRQRPQLPPPTPAEVAEGLRSCLAGRPPLSGTPVRYVLNRFDPTPVLAPTVKIQKPVPNEQWERMWIDRLRRAAAEKGEPLLRIRYDDWAVANHEPKAQTAQLRGHQWAEICELAGVAVKHGSPKGPRSDRVWSLDACGSVIDAFVDWSLRQNRRPSKGAYDRWLQDHRGPSWELLRRRFPTGLQDQISPRTVARLTEHFAGALDRLDAGEMIEPETYEGPLNRD